MKLPLEVRRFLDELTGYMELGMWDEAAGRLEEMPFEFRMDRRFMKIRLLISEHFGRWDMAEVVAGHLAKTHPDSAFYWIEWGRAARRAISVQRAIEILLDAEKHHPDEATVHYNLGCYACLLGQMDECKERLKRAFELDAALKLVAIDDPDLDALSKLQGEQSN